jgi:flagellum-specific ATP synthase
VRQITASTYVVGGLSRHVRLGEFVVHRSRTGLHLGEVVKVEPDSVVVCPIETGEAIGVNDPVFGRGPFQIAPDEDWCGRTINAMGQPIDGRGPLVAGTKRRSVFNAPPPSMTRRRVETALRTGVRAIDIFSPLCLGQRLGIFAGSGVGKSTLLSMLAHAKAFDRVVIALVGERGREVREFIEDTLGDDMEKSVAVVATSDESPMLRRMAPLTAMTVAEYFRDRGDNVLMIVDSITRFAHAVREVGVASGEPPVARGYPASVFTELPKLLERAGPGGRRPGRSRDRLDPGRWRQPQRSRRRRHARHSRRPHRAQPDACRRRPLPADRSAGVRIPPGAQGLEGRRGKARDAAEGPHPPLRGDQGLRLIGGYRPGVDADLDMAVKQVPVIYEVLRQTPDEKLAVDAFDDLATEMKKAAGIGKPAAAAR